MITNVTAFLSLLKCKYLIATIGCKNPEFATLDQKPRRSLDIVLMERCLITSFAIRYHFNSVCAERRKND